MVEILNSKQLGDQWFDDLLLSENYYYQCACLSIYTVYMQQWWKPIAAFSVNGMKTADIYLIFKKWSTLEILKHWIAPSPQKNNLTDLFVYCTVQLNTYTANWKSFPSWYNPEWKDCDVLIAALLWVTWHISGIARIFLKLRKGSWSLHNLVQNCRMLIKC